MGTSLTGLTPATTYDALIKVGDNGPIDATLKVLSDGLGNNLPMEASNTTINFTNGLQQSGVAVPTASQVNAKQDTLVSGTNIKTINGTSILGAGNIVTPSPSGVSGAIQFSNGSAFASDASNFFWDNTNKRLGVGTNAPTGKTQITESFTTTGNNYSAITFDGTLTSRATASDTIFGFRNTQSIIATATGQTIIANDLTPNYTFFDGNTNSIALRIGGLKNTQNNISAILMQQTVGAGNNGLSIGPANSRWEMGYCSGQSSQIASARIVYSQNGIKVGSENSPASTGLFEVRGTGSTSATTSLSVQNSAGLNALQVNDDRAVILNGSPSSGYVIDANGSNASARFGNCAIGTWGVGGIFSIGSTNSTAVRLATNNTSAIYLDTNQSVNIGTVSAVASAKLQVDSTTQGFLPPRMTTTQKNAIASPAAGLVVYDSTTNKLCCYNGSTWNDLF